MRKFFASFERQVPGIIDRLDAIKKNVDAIRGAFDRLLFVEKERIRHERYDSNFEDLMKKAVEQFKIALWAKNLKGRFIFANRKCCQLILNCTFLEVREMSDDEFSKNPLSYVCIDSDNAVMKSMCTKRFFEFGFYNTSGFSMLDVTKSPFFDEENELAGTMGMAIAIRSPLDDSIKQMYQVPRSIEIDIDDVLSKEVISNLLIKGHK